jgi:hypothetical protein
MAWSCVVRIVLWRLVMGVICSGFYSGPLLDVSV